MRPCHTANSKDNKPVFRTIVQRIDIVEQPMQLLQGDYFFNNE